ncbi:hypothetical protein [Catenulispora pinisilvae]|uniref:hypothetical protein n=1 Tax=Catenulispora pinisilvae TaxID=2705253 RepID=UPI0018918281|nr:hypothetical protein [Catenulispora pinisilvae]
MAHPDDGGGGQFSMIDPVAFAAMVATLSTNSDTLQTDATGLQSNLDYFGIAPGDMSTVLSIVAWVQDQLPMLRRRQSLAEALARGVPKNSGGSTPMVFLDEPVSSTSQAVASGQTNAKAMQKWLDNNDGSSEIDPSLLADLSENKNYPAYRRRGEPGHVRQELHRGPDRPRLRPQQILRAAVHAGLGPVDEPVPAGPLRPGSRRVEPAAAGIRRMVRRPLQHPEQPHHHVPRCRAVE